MSSCAKTIKDMILYSLNDPLGYIAVAFGDIYFHIPNKPKRLALSVTGPAASIRLYNQMLSMQTNYRREDINILV